jgi:predicted house-cleaning noncanonical NTP pyrophosphatase (MazG superfamily)
VPREYDKLVRDDIPQILYESDETPVTHVADGEELDRRLAEKLVEEAREFEESGRLEELADMVAVIDAILVRNEEEWKTLRELVSEKESERGGFEDGIVLECVEE